MLFCYVNQCGFHRPISRERYCTTSPPPPIDDVAEKDMIFELENRQLRALDVRDTYNLESAMEAYLHKLSNVPLEMATKR